MIVTVDDRVLAAAVASAIRQVIGSNLLVVVDGRTFTDTPDEALASAISTGRFEKFLAVTSALVVRVVSSFSDREVVFLASESEVREAIRQVATRQQPKGRTIREALGVAIGDLDEDDQAVDRTTYLHAWIKEYGLACGVVLDDRDVAGEIAAVVAELGGAR